MKNKSKIKLFRGKYYVLSENSSATEDLKTVLKNYMKKFDDGFDNWKYLKDTVYELTEHVDFFHCSCTFGLQIKQC